MIYIQVNKTHNNIILYSLTLCSVLPLVVGRHIALHIITRWSWVVFCLQMEILLCSRSAAFSLVLVLFSCGFWFYPSTKKPIFVCSLEQLETTRHLNHPTAFFLQPHFRPQALHLAAWPPRCQSGPGVPFYPSPL